MNATLGYWLGNSDDIHWLGQLRSAGANVLLTCKTWLMINKIIPSLPCAIVSMLFNKDKTKHFVIDRHRIDKHSHTTERNTQDTQDTHRQKQMHMNTGTDTGTDSKTTFIRDRFRLRQQAEDGRHREEVVENSNPCSLFLNDSFGEVL